MSREGNPSPMRASKLAQAKPPRAETKPRRRAVFLRYDGRELAAIFFGGAWGTLARAGLGVALPHAPTSWPWPTFIVNVVACLMLGYFVTRLQERLPLSSYRRPMLGTGFCGGLSTF